MTAGRRVQPVARRPTSAHPLKFEVHDVDQIEDLRDHADASGWRPDVQSGPLGSAVLALPGAQSLRPSTLLMHTLMCCDVTAGCTPRSRL